MLVNLANSIRPEELAEPPLAYRLFKESLDSNTFIGYEKIELIFDAIKSINRFHFDHRNILLTRVRPQIDYKKISHLMDYLDYSNNFSYLSIHNLIHAENYDYLVRCYNKLPDCIKNLTGDERFLINNELSVAFLYGVVTIPKGGISSPHLHGCFSFTSRRENTGYLSLGPSMLNNHNVQQEKIQEILNWLKQNNPLYKDFNPLTFENYEFRIDPNRNTSGSVATSVILPQNNVQSTDRNGFYILYKFKITVRIFDTYLC